MAKTKILIVEDERIVAEDIKRSLQNMGYAVSAIVSSGKEALRKTKERKPDLVLMDIVLEDEMSGIKAAGQIHSRFNIPVVYLTAYADEDLLEQAKITKPFGYILKPFEDKELRSAIEMALYKYRAEEALRKAHEELEIRVKERTAELAKSNEELRESEEKYKTVTESSLTGIFIHQDGKFVFVNNKFAEIHGYTPEELLGKEYFTLIHPDERQVLRQIASKRLKGKAAPQRYEVRRLRKDGETIWCEMMATCIEYKGRPAIMGNIIDITKRKRTEEALKKAGQERAAILNSMSELLIFQDLEHRVIWANRAAGESVGLAPEQLVGRHCYEIWHKYSKPCVGCPVVKARETEQPQVGEMTTPDGRVWFLRGYPMKNTNGNIVGIVEAALDITERKRAEEALRESEEKLRFLSSHLLTAQERERRRVSIELHDELGQALTVLKLKLRSIKGKLGTNQTEIKQGCEDTLQYINQVVENVRRLSRDLSPSILDDLGLSAALRWLIHDFTKHYNIKTSLDMEDISNLFSGEAQIIIYRIFQESLTNIGKHAQATSVSVVIKRQDGSVSFVVKDDGKGFDVKRVLARHSTEKSLGLAAMDERARMLGGSLDIWSQEGKGSKITFTIPLYEGGSL